MNIREKQEAREREYFSKYAAFSCASLGRDKHETPCDIRTVYQRDRDRILHSKAFRRLRDKTQVFLAAEGDHYRTRLTHTLEVVQNARTIARALGLNEDLTEAIGMGHDLGHTPFGHAGERALNSVCKNGFEHNIQSIRVVEKLEKKGQGLNLTKEVRDGILNHQTDRMPSTLEGKIVRLSDKIAYINHDIDDAIRAQLLREEDLPKECTDILGCTSIKRINSIIHDIVANSEGKDDIIMSTDFLSAMMNLRKYMFESVYTNPKAKAEEEKAKEMLIQIFTYYSGNIHKLPQEYISSIEDNNEDKERVVSDYIAGMTDRYAMNIFREIFIPKSWKIF